MIASVAKRLLNSVHDRAIFSRRVEVLARHLAEMLPGDARKVLDLGCGDGSIAARVTDLRPGVAIEGVDVLVRPNTHIAVTRYDGQTLPFADDSFDYVTIIDVLHHTDDPAAVLREAARVAGRGVVVKDHLREGLLAGPTLRAMDWVGNRGRGVRLPYNYLSEPQWDEAFAAAGLVPAARREDLGLYPKQVDWAFGRRLHFMLLLERRKSSG